MSAQFYYDIVCPYAYMAFTFLQRAGVFDDKRLVLKPILLGGLFKEMGVDTNPNRALSQNRQTYLRNDIARQARYFNVSLVFHERHPISTVGAMRLLTACSDDNRPALTERLYQCYWLNGIDIDSEALLAGLKHEFNISDDDLVRAKDELHKATREAFDKKVFGVPTVIINDQRFFGADRLELLQKDLGIYFPERPWQKSEPIDCYFDFSSPYSYLGYGEVKRAMAEGATFNLKPVLLGAIFKAIGTNDIPMLTAHPHKASYYLKDMHDWAQHRGLPFAFNSRFPLRTVTPLRVALLEPRAIDAIFTAAWAENLDIGDDAVLQGILDKAGIGKENLLERSHDDHIKEKLKENTAAAIARGVFGVPSFFVRGELVFGQDRFPWMRHEI